MENQSKVYTSVDLFKFFAAALIVCIHTRPFYAHPTLDLYWTRLICQVAVPFFFCFSSYIFFKRGKSIKSYIKRMLSLYLVWFIIEIPFIYLRFFHHQPILPATKTFIIDLLFHNTFFASWFITASWQAMLIVWLLAKRSETVTYLTGLAFFGLFTYMVGGGNLLFLNDALKLPSFVQAVPYVTLGYFMAKHEGRPIKNKTGLLLLLLFLIIAVLEVRFFLPSATIGILPLTFILVLLLINNNFMENTPFVGFCRKSSILIYLLHGVIKHILVMVTEVGYGPTMFMVTWTISVLFAYIIIKGSGKFSLLRKLY